MGRSATRTVYTSIAPRGLEKQFKAVSSWLHLGYRVRSLNSAPEIAEIEHRFPRVEFVQVERTAMDIYGRPLIFLDDIFDTFMLTDEPVLTIINSDVALRPRFQSVAEDIYRAANRTIAFGTRVDVHDGDFKRGEIYFGGYDYFFADRILIPKYPRSNMAIGATWWDYWIVMIPILNQITPRLINARLAAHPYHEIAWTPEILLKTLQDLVQRVPMEFEGIDGMDFDQVNERALRFTGLFAEWCKKLIYHRSSPIFPKHFSPRFTRSYQRYIRELTPELAPEIG